MVLGERWGWGGHVCHLLTNLLSNFFVDQSYVTIIHHQYYVGLSENGLISIFCDYSVEKVPRKTSGRGIINQPSTTQPLLVYEMTMVHQLTNYKYSSDMFGQIIGNPCFAKVLNVAFHRCFKTLLGREITGVYSAATTPVPGKVGTVIAVSKSMLSRLQGLRVS